MIKTERSSRQSFSFVVTFIISFALCLFVTGMYVRNKSELEFSQMEQIVETRTHKINTVISKLLYKTQTLSALVIQSNGDVKDFERVAATIIDDPSIRNVILAPDGVVSHIYPLEGNEQALGLDYFSEGAGNKEAILAKQTGELVLGGPFELVQGGHALVGRLPVYINAQEGRYFWGLVSVTLSYPQALEGAELEQLHQQGFAYEIWRVSPDDNQRQIIAHSNYSYNKNSRFIEQPIQIMNANWFFRLSPIRNWYQYPETWIFSISGILISLLFASLVHHNRDLRMVKTELEDITYNDQLTGILNRRGLFKALDALCAEKDTVFTLCYLDINKFKTINDTLGHMAGDFVLQQFAQIFQEHLHPDEHIFARIGGDEFILIFKDVGQIEDTESFFTEVAQDLQNATLVEDGASSVTFSLGRAVYPQDGTVIDELIRAADSKMYQHKASRQQDPSSAGENIS